MPPVIIFCLLEKYKLIMYNFRKPDKSIKKNRSTILPFGDSHSIFCFSFLPFLYIWRVFRVLSFVVVVTKLESYYML